MVGRSVVAREVSVQSKPCISYYLTDATKGFFHFGICRNKVWDNDEIDFFVLSNFFLLSILFLNFVQLGLSIDGLVMDNPIPLNAYVEFWNADINFSTVQHFLIVGYDFELWEFITQHLVKHDFAFGAS